MGEESDEYPDLPELPEDSKKICRYIDFTQLCSILERKALWFNRVDRYKDPMEGSHSRKTVKTRGKRSKRWVKQEDLPDWAADDLLNDLPAAFKKHRQSSYLNCWHLNERESMAMWELYSTEDQGVAIQTRVGGMKEALRDEGGFINRLDIPFPNDTPEDRKFTLGKVRYIDYDNQFTPEGNLFAPLFHKRLSYEHEHEFRIAFSLFNTLLDEHNTLKDSENGVEEFRGANLPLGKYIEVNLERLIEKIHILPQSDDWFFELVKKVVKRYGVSSSIVKRSSLEEDPVF